MAEKEYIEREAANDLIKAECSPKVAAYLIDAVATIPAADAIEELSKPRWIPVTERLPEIRKAVLITDGIGVGIGWMNQGWMNQGWWSTWFADIRRDEVTNWMPKPTPPTAEEGE